MESIGTSRQTRDDSVGSIPYLRVPYSYHHDTNTVIVHSLFKHHEEKREARVGSSDGYVPAT